MNKFLSGKRIVLVFIIFMVLNVCFLSTVDLYISIHEPESHGCKFVDEWFTVQDFASCPPEVKETADVYSQSLRYVRRVSSLDIYLNEYSAISEWHRKFENFAETNPDKVEKVTVRLERQGDSVYEYNMTLPGKDYIYDHEYGLVERYFNKIVQNLLVIYGADTLKVNANERLVESIKKFLLESKDDSRKLLGKYLEATYGNFSIESNGDLAVFPEGRVKSIEVVNIENIKGYSLGLDFGAGSIKVVLLKNGKLVEDSSKRYNWGLKRGQEEEKYESSREYKNADDYLNRVSSIVKEFLDEQSGIGIKDVNRIGISWAGAVNSIGEISGRSKIVEGLNDDEFDRIREFGSVITSKYNIPVSVLNDGMAGAYWAVVKKNLSAGLVLGSGTSLAGGYVTDEGKLPMHLLELSKTSIDMRENSPYEHSSVILKGVLQQLVTEKGMLNIAGELGIKLEGNKDMEKAIDLKKKAYQGDETARKVFEIIGKRLGEAAIELSRYLDGVKNFVLFGGVLAPVSIDSNIEKEKGNQPREIVIDNVKKVIGQKFNVLPLAEDSAFSAAIGAAYAVSSVKHFKN